MKLNTEIKKLLINLGFEEDLNHIAFYKKVQNKNNPQRSVDLTVSVVGEISIRVFFCDWPNYFDIDNIEQLTQIIDFYTKKEIPLGCNIGDECLKKRGFVVSPHRKDIWTKDFGDFSITSIAGYFVQTRFKRKKPYENTRHHNYIATEKDLDDLIDFYKNIVL